MYACSEDPINMPFVVFQTGVLHTTSSGERRIRVITLALPTTSSIADLYATADPVAIATLLANKAVERSMQAKLEDARDAVTNKMVDILGSPLSFLCSILWPGCAPDVWLCLWNFCIHSVQSYDDRSGKRTKPPIGHQRKLEDAPVVTVGFTQTCRCSPSS